jgi:hypothetical protein
MNPNSNAPLQRRLRPSALNRQGGASSLLRLARPASMQLPSGAALQRWADRAASMLEAAPMVLVHPASSHDLVVPLHPSVAVVPA